MLRLRFRTKVLLPFLFGFRDDVTGTFLLLDGPGASPSISASVRRELPAMVLSVPTRRSVGIWCFFPCFLRGRFLFP